MMNPLGQLHIEMECQEKIKRMGPLAWEEVFFERGKFGITASKKLRRRKLRPAG